MTPETSTQIIAQIISYLGTTPILLVVVLLLLGPWGAVVWVITKLSRALGKISSEISGQMQETSTKQATHMQQVFERQDKRFEQVVRMYEDNVALVKNYERHVDTQRQTNDKLIELVAISTATQEQLVQSSRSSSEAIMKMIENNEYCPYSRVKGRMHISSPEGKS